MSKTDIDKVLSEDENIIEDDSNLLQISDPKNLVVDLSVSLSTRMKALEACKSREDMTDVINRIGTMFIFSEAKMIEKYLYEIVHSSQLDPYDKLLASKTLKCYSRKGYDCYDMLCSNTVLHISVRVDCMCILLEDEEYREKGVIYLDGFLNDKKIDGYYRYKTIISKSDVLGDNIYVLLKKFIENEHPLSFKILACQYILVNNKEESCVNFCQRKLLEIVEDHTVNYNVRADATDVLLQYGDDEHKNIAKLVLDELSMGGRTIYENHQNVHTKSIEESVNKTLCDLSEKVEFYNSFESCVNEFLEYLNKDEKYRESKNIRSSIERISVDRAIYGTVNMTLGKIFSKVWTYIKGHKYFSELLLRLFEELDDASGLCSTGYVSRMLNCLSGITDLTLSISYQDQVIANMGARLNNKICEIDDEKYRDCILEEMTYPSYMYLKRPNFLNFFRNNILKIREELYEEFKGLITDLDFDIYTKKAIMIYQGDLS